MAQYCLFSYFTQNNFVWFLTYHHLITRNFCIFDRFQDYIVDEIIFFISLQYNLQDKVQLCHLFALYTNLAHLRLPTFRIGHLNIKNKTVFDKICGFILENDRGFCNVPHVYLHINIPNFHTCFKVQLVAFGCLIII